ncbi:Exodeoxyribonuclease 7 large subunit [Pirellulimonas nuda]|uniref:Exodeoxyribonuclease 7 large subunit n=1 Tax=Pirellulimonas nuda TaxID=2528009 RepID=A0A518D782_9BACT|nr:exodeoxyribonuclease VII large subunit [Pirellulimonas nuda]QDU87342.1 Exodeoxyribonuclease 7 large subunit [Pirellulimonas nuda]
MSQLSSPRTAPPDAAKPLTVSQFSAQLKGLVEGAFPSVWVAGEVSNFSRPQSGHCYFTLKDEHAQLRAVMWRGSQAKLKFDLRDGVEIVCRGSVDVYAPRGSYQLVVSDAQPMGLGALELALRQLQEKLGREGLFDAERKRPLPKFPRRIGFVTSPTGAAIRDFLQVLERRWRGAQVLVIPCRVQGDGAAKEIAAGIELAQRIVPTLDVLVVGRGGGSVEDLWCFNEEVVVRALAVCEIPTVSAVGHEIDVTLSDLAADVRALTPTEAAERVVPSAEELRDRLGHHGQRLAGALRRKLELSASRLEGLKKRRPLARPHAWLEDLARGLDDCDRAAQQAVRRIADARSQRARALAGKLDSLSPLGVLGRGYSLTMDAGSGAVLRSVKQVEAGQKISTRLVDGVVQSVVG